MDFVTHSLMGAGAARLATARREWLPQTALAGLFGSLLMDGDSWLYLLGPNYYGFYHRVATHSLVGLAVMATFSAGLAWLVEQIRPWRRFGWFVWENLPAGAAPPSAPFPLLLGVAGAAVLLHFCFDAITGFGNMEPFWPWSHWDASLKLVFSFDTLIFSATLGWWGVMRWKDWPRRRDALWTALYAALIVTYLLLRARFGTPTYI